MTAFTRRIAPLLCCIAFWLGSAQVQAGVIPWMYNAVFGYGPVFGGGYYGAGDHGGGGYGYGSGMGYPAAPMYGPGYVAPSIGPCGPGGCGTTTLNYGPGVCCDTCNPCDSCSPCSTCGTGVNFSPAPASGSQTQPTPSPKPPLPGDDFQPTAPRDRDEQVLPNGGNAAPFEAPVKPAPGEPSEGDVKPSGADEVEVKPLTLEAPLTSTLGPIRRRTGLSIGYKLPTVARVAITPSRPAAAHSPQLAGK